MARWRILDACNKKRRASAMALMGFRTSPLDFFRRVYEKSEHIFSIWHLFDYTKLKIFSLFSLFLKSKTPFVSMYPANFVISTIQVEIQVPFWGNVSQTSFGIKTIFSLFISKVSPCWVHETFLSFFDALTNIAYHKLIIPFFTNAFTDMKGGQFPGIPDTYVPHQHSVYKLYTC